MGRLTRDPETRYVAGGSKQVTKFCIAVDGPKKKDGQNDALFLDCVAWDKRAETINQYFKKGQRILVRGRLQIRSYDDKDGNKRRATDLTVDDFNFIEKREDAGSGYQRASGGDDAGFNPDAGFDPDEIPFNLGRAA
jgi:single-strand DNA-binding protein